MSRASKFTSRSEHANLAADLQIIVKPVRYLAARHALYGNGDRVRPRWRRRDGVTAIDRLAVYLKFKRDELAGLENKRPLVWRAKEKALYVMRFLTHVAADERIVDVAVPACRKLAPKLGLGDSVRGGPERRLIAHHLFLRF